MPLTIPQDHLLDPIDLVEALAEDRAWNFDRIGADRIAIEAEGRWQVYSLSVIISGHDAVLRLAASFSLEVREDRRPVLFDVVNRVNDGLWLGAFAWWEEEGLMLYRAGLPLDGGALPAEGQIERMLSAAVDACEAFYPAFQVAAWGNGGREEALALAVPDAVGHA